MYDFVPPLTFPLRDRIDLLLDSERVHEALEVCDRTGTSLEIRNPGV